MQSKFKKAVFSIILIIMMIAMAGQNVIYAVDIKQGPIYINGSQVIEEIDGKGIMYTWDFGEQINGHAVSDYVRKMQKVNDPDEGIVKATNFYCLRAAVDPGNQYDYGYDMIDHKQAIGDLEGEKYSVYRDTVSEEIYIPLMWIFDHMYVEGSSSITIDKLLENAGIKRIHDDYYNSDYLYAPEGWYNDFDHDRPFVVNDNGTIKDVMLDEAEVKVAQQLAIWYFTNGVAPDPDNEYYKKIYTTEENRYERNALSYITKKIFNDSSYSETDVDYMKKEQIAILCNYFIEKALEAKENGYESQTNTNTASLDIHMAEGGKVEKVNSKYVIGPLIIDANGVIENLSLVVKKGNQTISNVELKKENQEPLSSVQANEKFFVEISEGDMTETLNLQVSANTMVTTKTLWVPGDPSGTTQPVVEYTRETSPIDKVLQVNRPDVKLFDLALRKEIIKVNNKTTFNNEQNYDATRTINIDTATISSGTTTATYNHRKDPIVVNTGDTVTYRIHIYNEGDIDGYASIIVDRLANGLELVEGITEVTSSKNNKYGVSYVQDTHVITFTLNSSTTPEVIEAYKGGNNLDEDYIDITCKVTQKANAESKHYLSNVAYIAEARDKDKEKVDYDRYIKENNHESSPDNVNGIPTSADELNVTNKDNVYHGSTDKDIFTDTNNETDYFAGQEDDDDFETVVVLPKEFDLKLMKNISKIISGTNVDENVRNLRVENYENLKPYGEITTANYQVKKAPIMVKTGDFITYTLTIYNEGELDGYATEISEDIPEGLEFVEDDPTNIKFEWEMYDENGEHKVTDVSQAKILKTNYLSKAKSSDKRKNLLHAFDGENKPDSRTIEIVLKVTAEDVTKIYRNEAAITDDADENGNSVKDRDSEPKAPEYWKKEDSDECYEDGPDYPKYKEDDEDYDNIRLARFDIALRKFITKVTTDANGNFNDESKTTSYPEREPGPLVDKLNTIDPETGKVVTTATYNHSKQPILLNAGDYVLYTIRVYNEGDIVGFAPEITDHLPDYLDFVTGTNFSVNSKWEQDPNNSRIIKTKALANERLEPFNGTSLDFADVEIICKVNENVSSNMKLTNIAEITQYADENGNRNKDIDSVPNDLEYPQNKENVEKYKDTEIERGDSYIPGQEDDDDFEKVVVRGPGKYDVILIKEDENGEDLNSKATFEVNGETKEVTGRLIIADDVVINANNVNTPDVYTVKETIPPDDYCTFDGIITITASKKITGNAYSLDKLDYEVKDKDGNKMDTTDAKVYLKDGNIYVEVVDHEKKDFDLALRKFITNISGNDVTSRIPSVSYENGKITYTHPKDVVTVHVDDIVTYTLRVFNEGELDGYAEKISDDIPEYLEFLPDNDINKEYRWVMLDKDGKETTDVKEAVRIMTDYTSRANGIEKNLLKAFDPNAGISDTNPAHLDVKVAFKVKDPNSNKYVIVNKAQISEDADENGNPIDDIDSIPDKWNDGEDDQDYENVKVEYFDLALLKYVTKVIVTDNGKTTTRNTGNTGADTDIMPKVEIHKKKVKTTVVKFEYTIKITNEGDIAGYAKEITDYVPNGLKFYAADNTGWTDEGNNVISTKLLENTLLQPGESATVKVVLRWINGENNLQTKINIAEISEDYNDKDVPDRDSTPDNQKEGEDDIDDAPVILGIKTGMTENIIMYIGVSLIILTVLGTGIVLIKKFVL